MLSEDEVSWIEIPHFQTIISGSIVNNCKSIFAQNGIPEIVISDNDPQFISKEFLALYTSHVAPIIHKETEKLNVQFRQWRTFSRK